MSKGVQAFKHRCVLTRRVYWVSLSCTVVPCDCVLPTARDMQAACLAHPCHCMAFWGTRWYHCGHATPCMRSFMLMLLCLQPLELLPTRVHGMKGCCQYCSDYSTAVERRCSGAVAQGPILYFVLCTVAHPMCGARFQVERLQYSRGS